MAETKTKAPVAKKTAKKEPSPAREDSVKYDVKTTNRSRSSSSTPGGSPSGKIFPKEGGRASGKQISDRDAVVAAARKGEDLVPPSEAELRYPFNLRTFLCEGVKTGATAVWLWAREYPDAAFVAGLAIACVGIALFG
jgi:hypothetical protein